MANIYELLSGYNTLWNLIEDGEASDEAIIEAFDNMNETLSEKLENCCKYIKNEESLISGLKEEEARLAERRRAKENGIKRLKELIKVVMNVAGEKKLPCGTFTVSVQDNPPKVVLDASIADIPSRYLVPQEPTVDKKLLLEDLKNISEIDEIIAQAIQAVAHIEKSSSIRIR